MKVMFTSRFLKPLCALVNAEINPDSPVVSSLAIELTKDLITISVLGDIIVANAEAGESYFDHLSELLEDDFLVEQARLAVEKTMAGFSTLIVKQLLSVGTNGVCLMDCLFPDEFD